MYHQGYQARRCDVPCHGAQFSRIEPAVLHVMPCAMCTFIYACMPCRWSRKSCTHHATFYCHSCPSILRGRSRSHRNFENCSDHLSSSSARTFLPIIRSYLSYLGICNETSNQIKIPISNDQHLEWPPPRSPLLPPPLH